MALTIQDSRNIVNTVIVGKDQENFTSVQLDHAIQAALNEAVAFCPGLTRTMDESLSCSADVAQLDLDTITGFDPMKVLRAEVAYPDKGTIESSGTYAELDLVQGTDNLYYVSKVYHTSSSSTLPPNNTYWSRVSWKGGFELEILDYDYVASQLNDSVDGEYNVYEKVESDSGRPKYLGWKTSTACILYPVPQTTWGVRLFFDEPSTDWTPGASGTTTALSLNIPETHLYPILWWGAPAYLQYSSGFGQQYAQQMRQKFEQHLIATRGRVGIDAAGISIDEERELI